jgi:hypothetical protein
MFPTSSREKFALAWRLVRFLAAQIKPAHFQDPTFHLAQAWANEHHAWREWNAAVSAHYDREQPPDYWLHRLEVSARRKQRHQ